MILVFLPAYNEEIALERLVKKFDDEFKKDALSYKIIVLDDGSKDSTVQVAEKLSKIYPLELLKHPVNQGLGQTLIDGFKHIAKISKPEDIFVTMDCDDTHDPKYMQSAFAKINEGYDFVILSRYQKGGGEEGLSMVRSVLSRGAGLFLKLFFPIKGVQEYSCGYRVIKASEIKKAIDTFGDNFVKLPHMGFVVTPEILIKFRMLGSKICEVPFVLSYDKKPGVSKNKPFKTIAGYFALIWLNAFRALPKQPAKISPTHKP